MPKNKKQVKRTVGVYVVRPTTSSSPTEVWDVLIHKRSAQVGSGKLLLATPGGQVDKGDCFDEHGILVESCGFKKAARREVAEETGLSIDSIDAGDFCEINRTDSTYVKHRNYLVVLRGRLEVAQPDLSHAWEIVPGGVADLGEPVPGGFHSWFPLSQLLAHPALFGECQPALLKLNRSYERATKPRLTMSAEPVSGVGAVMREIVHGIHARGCSAPHSPIGKSGPNAYSR